jgi:tRNA-specific adenosine deaminase 1
MQVLSCYEGLGQRGKPQGREWTVLAAIVLETTLGESNGGSPAASELSVLSLATGNKCIGASQMSKDGDVLHDSHAEVARRTL